jgi:hypothetical protein
VLLVCSLEKNSDTSHDDIRVFKAHMGHGAVNKLIGGTKQALYASQRMSFGWPCPAHPSQLFALRSSVFTGLR